MDPEPRVADHGMERPSDLSEELCIVQDSGPPLGCSMEVIVRPSRNICPAERAWVIAVEMFEAHHIANIFQV
eukprot:1018648-Lingulodinium_polyedra.AAC.1